MRRERLAAVFPGKTKLGFALWVIDDGTPTSVAVGSGDSVRVKRDLERFDPDLTVYPSSLDVDEGALLVPVGARKITFAHPSWKLYPARLPKGWKSKAGRLAKTAWNISFNEFVRRGGVRLNGPLPLFRYSGHWLDEYARRPK